MTSSNTGPIAQNQWLNRKEAADYLGVKIGTLAVWECTKRYNIPCYRVGKCIRYKRSDLDKAFISTGKKPGSGKSVHNAVKIKHSLDNE